MSTSQPSTRAPRRPDFRQLRRKLISEYSFVLSFILLIIIAATVNQNFFTWTNISNIFVQSSIVGLIALGMSMVISAGEIDISVGSQVAMVGGFGVLVLNQTGSALAMRPPEAAGCQFDIRLVLQDAREAVRRDADVCRDRTITLSPD